MAPEVLAVPEVPTGPSFEDLKQYNRTAKLRMWPLIFPSPGAHTKYNEWAGMSGRPLLPARPSPASSSFGIPAVIERSSGPPIIIDRGSDGNQQKRKAKDDNNGAIWKFLKKSE